MTPGPWPAPPLPRPALSNSLQQLSLGAARRPPDRLLAAPPHPWPAAAPASLYMYKLPINRTAAIMVLIIIINKWHACLGSYKNNLLQLQLPLQHLLELQLGPP